MTGDNKMEIGKSGNFVTSPKVKQKKLQRHRCMTLARRNDNAAFRGDINTIDEQFNRAASGVIL